MPEASIDLNFFFFILCILQHLCSPVSVSGVKVEVAASQLECTFGPASVTQGRGQGLLLFPEICLMELQLLASSSPDLDVLGHILASLLEAIRGHRCNATMIYQQVWLLWHYIHFIHIKNIQRMLMAESLIRGAVEVLKENNMFFRQVPWIYFHYCYPAILLNMKRFKMYSNSWFSSNYVGLIH